MATTLAELSADILEILQKTSAYQGYFTEAKVTAAINDSLDYIAGKMQLADRGWLRSLETLDVVAGVNTVTLPAGTVMLHGVWFATDGLDYGPLKYLTLERQPIYKNDSGGIGAPTTYSVHGNDLFFNPAPGISQTGAVKVMVTKFPDLLQAQGDAISSQFDRGLINYAKWRSASILGSLVENANPAWRITEREWEDQILQTIPRKVSTQKVIQGFEI